MDVLVQKDVVDVEGVQVLKGALEMLVVLGMVELAVVEEDLDLIQTIQTGQEDVLAQVLFIFFHFIVVVMVVIHLQLLIII